MVYILRIDQLTFFDSSTLCGSVFSANVTDTSNFITGSI